MLNEVNLIGNLGRDPEIRHTQSGKPIANMTVATTEYWKDKNTGERQDKTEWHRVVIFNEHLAKYAESYLKKGSKVYVKGKLQTRKWQDQSGVEKYTTEIVLQGFSSELKNLSPRDGNQSQGQSNYQDNQNHNNDDLDDDIPW